MPDNTFDLSGYVTVNERIRIFYEFYANGRLVTDDVQVLTAPDNKQRVMVKALAYRSPEDPHPGVGYSWMELPGSSTFTKGSELENTETSAWGRAIAALGILIEGGIASGQEVQSKKDDTPAPPPPPAEDELEFLGNLQKTGDVVAGSAALYKAEWRETQDGHAIGFRLKLDGDKDIPQVMVLPPIGEPLYKAVGKPTLTGHVTVKGRLYNVRRAGRQSYYRLVVGEAPSDFIQTDEVRVPPAEADTVELFPDAVA
jgi:hypothetical protein